MRVKVLGRSGAGTDCLGTDRAFRSFRVWCSCGCWAYSTKQQNLNLCKRSSELQAQIAERQAAEEQMRHLNLALQQRTAELEAANRELEAFNYSVSHDLRSPLSGISGFSQALVEDYGDALDETARHYLSRIQGNAHRMAALIDALLKLARVSRATVRPTKFGFAARA